VAGAVRLCGRARNRCSISMDSMELEGRPRKPLMLKEWLELEYSAELSRDGFGCYPRHLATEPRTRTAGCRRRRNGDVIARVSAAVRVALSRPPSARARQGEAAAAALRRSLSTRLRVVGFWEKRSGEVEKMDRHRPVVSCSATAASFGRRDGASSLAATSLRLKGRESRQAGGDRAGLSGGRRSHETVVGRIHHSSGFFFLLHERNSFELLINSFIFLTGISALDLS